MLSYSPTEETAIAGTIHLVIFAKAPVAGEVKTRLIPTLGAEGAADLYRAMIWDTLERTQTCRGLKRRLACWPSMDDPFFLECAETFRLERVSQRGQDLGLRMANVIRDVIGSGGGAVILMGTDLPTLPTEIIEQAADRLASAPVVLGPATDGGYYLIGTTRPGLPIFHDMTWGTPGVSRETLRRLREHSIPVELLPFWYDVDTMEDLLWLREHIRSLSRNGEAAPPRTAQFLEKIKTEDS